MGERQRKFSPELKLEAVRMVTDDGHGIADVARDLDLRPDMLRRWKRQLEADPRHAFPGQGRLKPDEGEMRRLRRELDRVRRWRLTLAATPGATVSVPVHVTAPQLMVSWPFAWAI
jgi:transposase